MDEVIVWAGVALLISTEVCFTAYKIAQMVVRETYEQER